MPSPVSRSSSIPPRTYNYERESQHTLKKAEREYGDPKVKDQVRPANTGPTVPVYSHQDTFEQGNQTRTGSINGPAGTQISTEVKGPGLKMDYSADAKAGLGGVDVDVKLNLDANLVSAGAKTSKTFDVDVGGGETIQVAVDLEALGKVGADGSLDLKLHLDKSGQVSGDIGISGFAGAKAGLTGGISVTHEGREVMSGELGVVATAGASFEAGAQFDVGLDGIKYSAKAQATVGVGAGFEISGTVDPVNVTRLATQAALPGDLS